MSAPRYRVIGLIGARLNHLRVERVPRDETEAALIALSGERIESVLAPMPSRLVLGDIVLLDRNGHLRLLPGERARRRHTRLLVRSIRRRP